MITRSYVAEMAAYNRWQNEVLYDLCHRLGEDARRADQGLFFRSLHLTLEHVLLVDEWVLDAVEQGEPTPLSLPGQARFDWAELRSARRDADARVEALARHEDIWFEGVVEIQSAALGRLRRIPRGLYVMQMFNHQTHHRAQATAALHRLGVSYGSTDIPARPGSPF